MSVLLQIRDVDERVRDGLKARAALQGLSLNAYLRQVLEQEVATPTLEQVLTRAAARAERSAVSSVDLVRAARDERAGSRP